MVTNALYQWTEEVLHSPHRLSLPQLAGGWLSTPADSPILFGPNIVSTSTTEYNPSVSKGRTSHSTKTYHRIPSYSMYLYVWSPKSVPWKCQWFKWAHMQTKYVMDELWWEPKRFEDIYPALSVRTPNMSKSHIVSHGIYILHRVLNIECITNFL